MTHDRQDTAGHTPEPWHRNIRANGKYPVVFAGRNQHVATVCQQTDGAETEANIDLVASAPELLTMLQAAYDHISECESATFKNGTLLGKMGRVLAKATGEVTQ